MLILTIRSDRPEAEIGLFDDFSTLEYDKWTAHRQLAETVHKKIEMILKNRQKTWTDIQGIVCFRGPGSFTGLRIGLSVGNALAYSLDIPIVSEQGEDWLLGGVKRLKNLESEKIVIPEYGSPVHITPPRN